MPALRSTPFMGSALPKPPKSAALMPLGGGGNMGQAMSGPGAGGGAGGAGFLPPGAEPLAPVDPKPAPLPAPRLPRKPTPMPLPRGTVGKRPGIPGGPRLRKPPTGPISAPAPRRGGVEMPEAVPGYADIAYNKSLGSPISSPPPSSFGLTSPAQTPMSFPQGSPAPDPSASLGSPMKPSDMLFGGGNDPFSQLRKLRGL